MSDEAEKHHCHCRNHISETDSIYKHNIRDIRDRARSAFCCSGLIIINLHHSSPALNYQVILIYKTLYKKSVALCTALDSLNTKQAVSQVPLWVTLSALWFVVISQHTHHMSRCFSAASCSRARLRPHRARARARRNQSLRAAAVLRAFLLCRAAARFATACLAPGGGWGRNCGVSSGGGAGQGAQVVGQSDAAAPRNSGGSLGCAQ